MGNNCCSNANMVKQEKVASIEITIQSHDRQCNSIENGCKCTKRMISSLQYYSSLNINDQSDADKLVDYCTNTYMLLLDDYIHIVRNHGNSSDLGKIYNLMVNDSHFKSCNIMHCSLISRHYRTRNLSESEYNEVTDTEFIFYRDVLDSMHCFIFHLDEMGLRMKHDESQTDDDEFEEMKDNYYDNYFANICNAIQAKKRKLKQLDILDHRFSNNKFCMQTNNDENDTAKTETFTDGLLTYMNEEGISERDTQKIQHLMLSEEYDSDALKHDVCDDEKDSNIALYDDCIEDVYTVINQYIYYTKLTAYSFNIGYIFYYWDYYKTERRDWEKREAAGEINSHSGFKAHELYIQKKYDTLKHEILNDDVQ